MHSLDFIRKNPDTFDRALARRGVVNASADVLALDKQRRELVVQLQQLQQARNEKSDAVARMKDKTGTEFAAAREAVKAINDQLESIKTREKELGDQLTNLLLHLPNMLSENVPDGATEESNVVVLKHGEPRKFDFQPKHHFELGEALGQMDFVQTARISGSRFVTLSGDLARLEKALGRFMLDIHTKEFGFREVSPPLLVLPSAMYGTSQLPKFDGNAFQTTDGYWLIPTSEVSLTNLVADSIVDAKSLPLRYTAFTSNFRSEAGSAGKDTRGMIRQHQFYKVELVTICSAEQYLEEYEHLMRSAQTVLERLELPFQKIFKCVGDTGFGSEQTYDFEVWMPAQHCYREISSCSICGQFQARRMKARYKTDAGLNENVFTMNGSGVAVGRTIAALLENFQEADGSVMLPKVLEKYMDGVTVLR